MAEGTPAPRWLAANATMENSQQRNPGGQQNFH